MKNITVNSLTLGKVFWFWLPLAAMWLMMGIEHPIITALIARLPDPEQNLAAFGITFSMALIIESPIIMLLTAATALAYNRGDYRLLLVFTHIMALSLTALHFLIVLTPAYRIIVGRFIGVPPEIIEPSRIAFLLMAPWSAAIAYRRLWQGVLIRFKRTGVVPLTILSRFLTSMIVLALGFRRGRVPGAYIGAAALSLGVIAAAFTAYGFSRPVVRSHLSSGAEAEEPLTWPRLLEFYLPLALTMLLTMAAQPILSIGLARAPEPLASLAIWPVVMGALFIIRSLGISYQEVVVALLADAGSFSVLRRFTRRLGLSLAGILALFAFSPLSGFWFTKVAGLSAKLADFTVLPMMVLAVVPGLESLLSWLRGFLVHKARTRIISQAVGLNLLVLAVVMLGGAAVLPIGGAGTAAIALTFALTLECLFLWLRIGAVGGELFGKRL